MAVLLNVITVNGKPTVISDNKLNDVHPATKVVFPSWDEEYKISISKDFFVPCEAPNLEYDIIKDIHTVLYPYYAKTGMIIFEKDFSFMHAEKLDLLIIKLLLNCKGEAAYYAIMKDGEIVDNAITRGMIELQNNRKSK